MTAIGTQLGAPVLVRLTLAVVDMPRAVAFYDAVLHADLTSVGSHGMHEGTLGGVPLLLVPNEIAELVPSRSMHMPRFAVRDLDGTLAVVLANGGRVLDRPTGEPGARLAAVTDAEDNVIELIEG